MINKNYPRVFDAATRTHIPDSTDLSPRILAHIQKEKTSRTRTRLLAVVVLVLIALLTLSIQGPAIAAAIQRWFGYVPGAGLVSQGQVRVLAEPVSLTREGVTLTIEQMVLDADGTLVIYKVDGVPASALSQNPPDDYCPKSMYPSLRFSNVTLVGDKDISNGSVSPVESGFEYRLKYAPIAPAENEAVFMLPCLYLVRSGAAPEDWEIPLRFIPAPPDMTVYPVIEIPSPSPAAPTAGVTPATPLAQARPTETALPEQGKISLSLDQAVPLEDGLLIYATLHWEDTSYNTVEFDNPQATIHLLDGNGQAIPFELIDDESTGMKFDRRQTVFAIKTAPVQNAGALTVVVDSVKVDLPELPAQASFVFDPGPNPQDFQIWELDQALQLGEYSLRVISASTAYGGYSFEMGSDSGVLGAQLIDADHASGAGGAGGDGGRFSSSFTYNDGLPVGPVTIKVVALSVRLSGPWQVTWQR